ncbi:TIR domain-containing protein, partial [Enterococcus faecium]
MRPRVFIGSSGEAKKFAFALQRNLEPDAEVTVWDQDVFRPGQFFLESLLQQLDNTDLGLFVFSP